MYLRLFFMAYRSRFSTPVAHFLPLVLLLVCLAFRLWKNESGIEALANFAPVLAFAFTGVLFLPCNLALWAPVLLQLGGDMLALGARTWWEFLPQSLPAYFCLALCGFWAWELRKKGGYNRFGILTRVVGASAGFYLITNALCWVGNPLYPQTFSGLVQCLVTGREGFPPTWWFGLKSLASDLLFTALVMQVCLRSPSANLSREPVMEIAS